MITPLVSSNSSYYIVRIQSCFISFHINLFKDDVFMCFHAFIFVLFIVFIIVRRNRYINFRHLLIGIVIIFT